jgi:hypothetical protein
VKILYQNPFVYYNVCVMLNEIFNKPGNELFKDYVMMFEENLIDKIGEIHKDGLKVIFYDMEHIFAADTNTLDSKIERFGNIAKRVDEFWTYSLENQKSLKNLGFDNVKFLPFRYTESLRKHFADLNETKGYNPPIDILFYGNMTQYRYDLIIKPLEELGLTFLTAHAVTGDKLDWLLINSKIILNTKSFENYYNQNVVRSFYPVINNKCVLSQHSNDDHYMGDSIEYFTDGKDLKQKIIELIVNDKWREIALQAGEKYKALSNSGDIWHTSDIEGVLNSRKQF